MTEQAFRRDRLFAEESRDGALDPYRLLRHRLAERGCEIRTADNYVVDGLIPDLILCIDAPAGRVDEEVPASWRGVPRWVILGEPEVVLRRNWESSVQSQFERLFTWRDSLVDDYRFFALHGPNAIDKAYAELSAPDRFCTLIAGNKASSHPLELYSARREAIRWFERHHPDEFDLYGVGWDRLVPGGPRVIRAGAARLPSSVSRALAPRFASYRGPIVAKREVLGRYRFSICFENARELDGYITEKFFDCLLAGTIPIYWGAPNITDHVPAACFVDFRDFCSYDHLYAHLVALSDRDVAQFRQAGQEFLRSELAHPFSTESWVETLLRHLV